ncbi:hypothetical protein [Microlunatus antarcticus]|uniref:Anti-sigma-K factor rskA n=1 Tax=Microlunatus antarcticus TaxID=53388 RepID=A0A7W5JY44_9ACTN|nr:hypothetical protein [Microlunatus antarcticus]MBB3328315.1 hypothetical protein [Microlunatus antarcticus]
MHTDPELLALLALGDPFGGDEERDHVASCRACAGELAELTRVVELAREAGSLTLAEPSPRVWSGVQEGLDARRAEAARDRRAYARLAPVLEPWSKASGEAQLATDAEGRRLLEVSLHAELPHGGVRQAWLVHRDDPAQRQTLGILDGPHGLWTVEQAIDLEQFPFLEISQQSIGSTQHSGQTIVRGELLPV